MSIAEEIRVGLAHKPNANADELSELCRSSKGKTHLLSNLNSFLARKEVIATKGKDGVKTYELNPDYSAASAKRKTTKPAKKGAKRRPAKKASKTSARKTTARAASKPAVLSAPAPLENHFVGKQANGDIFVMDRETGEFFHVVPAVALHIAYLAR